MQITIEKLVYGGQGLGRLEDGQVVFVWNALPGETVLIDVISKKKNYIEGIAREIMVPSPHRITPHTEAFLSSAPWDMMDYETECEWKIAVAKEVYEKFGKISLPNLSMASGALQHGYRNKIEFSFCDTQFVPREERKPNHKEDISLSFYARGSRTRMPVTSCALATPAINETAQYILNWIKQEGITNRTLKSLIVRSNEQGQTIAALFVKDMIQCDTYPALTDTFIGFHVYYSSHKSPASRPDELLYSEGASTLKEVVRGIPFEYGLLSFFQINPPVFETTLEDIAKHIEKHDHIIDYYSGVGAIGLSLAEQAAGVTLVDNNEEAIGIAKKIILTKNLTHCSAHVVPSEHMVDIISKNNIVIVDPPRAGLHPDVTNKLIEVQPKRIIYLSCDISTQARDIALLSPYYTVSFSKLYNYFPRTPHVEGLCVLERKS